MRLMCDVGLESHPQYEVAKRQMRGFSGMITCYLKGGLPESRAFLSSLKVVPTVTCSLCMHTCGSELFDGFVD